MGPSQVLLKPSHFFSSVPRAATIPAATTAATTTNTTEHLQKLQAALAAASADKAALTIGKVAAGDIKVAKIKHSANKALFSKSGGNVEVTFRPVRAKTAAGPLAVRKAVSGDPWREMTERFEPERKEKGAVQKKKEKEQEELLKRREAIFARKAEEVLKEAEERKCNLPPMPRQRPVSEAKLALRLQRGILARAASRPKRMERGCLRW